MEKRKKRKIIFLDGKMIEADASFIGLLSPGLIKGKGIFETMRSYEGRIFALESHFTRMIRGLNLLKIKVPYSRKKIKEYIYQTLELNKLKNANIRLMIWKNIEGQVKFVIICQSYGWPLERQYKKGFKAVVSQIRRCRTNYSHIKSINYLIFRKALQEARQQGYDEAILLNNHGELVEGARTNIFFIKKRILYTPAVHCGCLNGITRQMIIQCAQKIGIPWKAKALGINRLLTAEEAFLSNSLMGVMPLINVNGGMIGKGQVGGVTKQMLQVYKELATGDGITKKT